MADLAVWQRTIVDEEGNVVPGADVEVRREEDGSLATLYADRAGETPLANPLAADMSGFVRFFAQGDAYTITAVGAGSTRTWRFDPTGRLKEFDRISDALAVDDGADTAEARSLLGTFSTVADVQSRHIPAVLESIRTEGRDAPGDGRGGLYARVASEPDHLGKVQSGDGAWWELVPEGRVKGSTYGLTPENATEELARFLELYDETLVDIDITLPTSGTIEVEPRAGASILFEGRLLETGIPNDPKLRFSGSVDVTISGLTYQGNESFGTWDLTERPRIELVGMERATVSASRFSGLSSCLMFDNCERSRVIDSFFEFDLHEPIDEVGNEDRLSAAISFNGGRNNSVVGGYITKFGNGIVQVGSGEGLTIDRVVMSTLVDNGVYVSSGDFCSVSNCHIINVVDGSSIKMRGKNNVCRGNRIEGGTGTSITMTGQGLVDSDGYNGWGLVVEGNTFLNVQAACRFDPRPDTNGVDGHIKGGVFANNTIIGASDGDVALRLAACDSMVVTGNVFHDIAGMANSPFLLVGNAGRISRGNVISGNVFTRCEGEVLRFTYCEDSVISNNVVEDSMSPSDIQIEFRYAKKCIINGNRVEKKIRLNTTFTCVGNVAMGNLTGGTDPTVIVGDDTANHFVNNFSHEA